ncbi:MAG: hypothetical protein ACWA44_08125 [Thiotrichales bacterium]
MAIAFIVRILLSRAFVVVVSGGKSKFYSTSFLEAVQEGFLSGTPGLLHQKNGQEQQVIAQ